MSNQKDYTNKISGLSIAAFVLSILGCFSIIGIILGIIDLTKNDGRKKGLSIAAVVIGVVITLGAIGLSMNSDKDKTSLSDTTVATESAKEESIETSESATEIKETKEEVVKSETSKEDVAKKEKKEPKGKDEKEPQKSEYNISVAENSGDMHLKDIAERNDIYIGLSYVKRMDYLPLALNQNQEVDSSNEVIIPFFELFNGGTKKQNFNDNKITCYVDGSQVDRVDATLKTDIDGIKAINGSYELEAGTKALLTKNFEVPREWSEIKIFYDDGCVWTVNASEVSTDKFENSTLFNVNVPRDVTPEGTVIFDDDYKVTYKGYEEYTDDTLWGPQDYAIIKLTVENTSSKALDYSLVGYNMRGYCNDYLMDSPNYTLDKKFESFINIHNIDSIQTGMSADCYVAYEIPQHADSFYFVYDTGYIIDNALGSVYIEN